MKLFKSFVRSFLFAGLILTVSSNVKSQEIPNYVWTDLNGTSHNVHQYLEDGNYVILRFFGGTWCPPCWNLYESRWINDMTGKGPKDIIPLMVNVTESRRRIPDGRNELTSSPLGDWITGNDHPIISILFNEFIEIADTLKKLTMDNNAASGLPLVIGILPNKSFRIFKHSDVQKLKANILNHYYSNSSRNQSSLINFLGDSVGIVKNISIDDNVALAVTTEGYIFRSTDSGSNWNFVLKVDHPLYNIIQSKEGDHMIVGYNGTLLKSVDNGESWQKISTQVDWNYNVIQDIGNSVFLGAHCGRYSIYNKSTGLIVDHQHNEDYNFIDKTESGLLLNSGGKYGENLELNSNSLSKPTSIFQKPNAPILLTSKDSLEYNGLRIKVNENTFLTDGLYKASDSLTLFGTNDFIAFAHPNDLGQLNRRELPIDVDYWCGANHDNVWLAGGSHGVIVKLESACSIQAGTIVQNGPKASCDTSAILCAEYNPLSGNLNPGDILSYILHSDPNNALATVEDTSSNGCFRFKPSLTIDQSYYVSAVVGPKDPDFIGNVDRSQSCIDVSDNYQEVSWISAPKPSAGTDYEVCGLTDSLIANNVSGNITWSTVDGGMISDPATPITVVTVPSPGTYRFVISVDEGSECSGSDTVSITFYDQPRLASQSSICINPEDSTYQSTIEISGGTQPYSVDNQWGEISGSIFVSDTLIGQQEIQITDRNGCSFTLNLDGKVICDCGDSQLGDFDITTANVCLDQCITATTNGNQQIQSDEEIFMVLYEGSQSSIQKIIEKMEFNPSSTFSYNFCFDDQSMTPGRTYYTAIMIHEIDHQNDDCIRISNGLPVSWNEAINRINQDNIDICGDSETIELTGIPTSVMDLQGDIDLNFNRQPSFDVSGGFDSYDVDLQIDNNGCITMESFQVTFNEVPTAQRGVTTDLNCDRPEAHVGTNNMESMLLYNWSSNDGIIISGKDSSRALVGSPGLYELIVTDAISGCMDTASVSVTGSGLPIANIGIISPSCVGDTNGTVNILSISGNGSPHTILLDDAPVIGTPITGLSAGEYELQVTDVNDCIFRRKITIEDPETIEIIPLTVLNREFKLGESVAINNDIINAKGPASYIWMGDTLAINCLDCKDVIVLPRVTTRFKLMATDSAGCIDQEEYLVLVEKGTESEVITPNGDCINDALVFSEIELFPNQYADAELIILNRWGQVIYQEAGYKNDWIGNNNDGNPLPEGTYYYVLNLDLFRGEVKKGSVLLVR